LSWSRQPSVYPQRCSNFTYFLDDPERPPELARFACSGTLYARRAFGRALRGNCVSVVITEQAN
jgi:hypothetical protein